MSEKENSQNGNNSANPQSDQLPTQNANMAAAIAEFQADQEEVTKLNYRDDENAPIIKTKSKPPISR